jgi:hypothetical protein
MEELIIKLETQLNTYKTKLDLYICQKKGLKTINKLKRRVKEIQNQLNTAKVLKSIIQKKKQHLIHLNDMVN